MRNSIKPKRAAETESSNRKNLEKLFLKKDDADDIIIVKNNFITDTSIANIALYNGGNWHTPNKHF